MTRKFKHKKLGWVAELIDNNLWAKLINEERLYPVISRDLILDSCDWEEIIEKEVLFTTEDGIEIGKDYLATLYSCMKNITCRGEQILHFSVNKWFNEGRKKTRLIFANESKCRQYIEDNIPTYSRKQINKALERINSHHNGYIVDIKKELGIW